MAPKGPTWQTCTHTSFVSITSLDVCLRAHPVRDELHIQRYANRKGTRIIQKGYSQRSTKQICKHRHERLQKFLQGWAKSTFFCLFQVADHTMQMDVHITLYPFCTTKKMPHVTATRAGLKPMQLHWAPRHGVWVDCSFLPDTPCA